ncbi:MAG TPA: Ldh family oxidoreductase [bacterium]|nr:Ldh family oxidoreductase [bacterium]
MTDRPAGPFSPASLRTFFASALDAAGLVPEEAAIVADVLIEAEERGYDSQGVMRLPSYLDLARGGGLRSPARLDVRREAPAAFSVDAHDGWGPVVGLRVMQMCVERARQTGVCVASIVHLGHVGRLGHYVEAAARENLIGIFALCGNPGSATMAPWGGREPRLSTNPLALGFPRPGGDPIVVDISSTQAARGKILLAAARGEPIPDSWAFDGDGYPTTDPKRGLPPAGSLAPLGGHKGYAIAVAVELLCGGLAGEYPPKSAGVFVAAINVAAVTNPDDYAYAAGEVDRRMQSSPLRPGFDEILLPGAGSARRKRAAERDGIRVPAVVWRAVVEAAGRVGVVAPDA